MLRQQRFETGVLNVAIGLRGKKSTMNRRHAQGFPRERAVAPACAFSDDPALVRCNAVAGRAAPRCRQRDQGF